MALALQPTHIPRVPSASPERKSRDVEEVLIESLVPEKLSPRAPLFHAPEADTPAETLGARRACLARELTKQHEEVLRDEAGALAARLEESPPRGECTLVIEGDPVRQARQAGGETLKSCFILGQIAQDRART